MCRQGVLEGRGATGQAGRGSGVGTNQRRVFARSHSSHPHPASRGRVPGASGSSCIAPSAGTGRCPRLRLDSAGERCPASTGVRATRGTAARLPGSPCPAAGGAPAPAGGRAAGRPSKEGQRGVSPGEQRRHRGPGLGPRALRRARGAPPWVPAPRFHLRCAALTVNVCISELPGHPALPPVLSAGRRPLSAQLYRHPACLCRPLGLRR